MPAACSRTFKWQFESREPIHIDDPADEITSLTVAEKVKLLSRLMEAEGTNVDWSVVAGIQRRHKDTPALRRQITLRRESCPPTAPAAHFPVTLLAHAP